MNFKQILANAASNAATLLAAMAINFFLYPFLIRHLGETVYGVWALLGSVTGYLGVLDLGIGSAIIKYVAESRGEAGGAQVRSVTLTGFRLYLGLSGLIVVIGLLAFFLVPDLSQFAPALMRDVRWVFLIVTIDFTFTLAFSAFGSALNGLQRFDLGNSVNLGRLLLRAGLIVLLVRSGYGLIGLALASLVVNRMADLALLFIFRRLQGGVGPASGGAAFPLRKMLDYGVYVFVNNLSGKIFYYSDNIVIGAMLGVGQVTHYVAAFTLVEVVRNLNQGLASALMPVASEVGGEGEGTEKLRRLFETSSKILAIFSVPPLLALIVTGDSFLRAWVGPGFDDAYWCLVVLAVPQLWILSQGVGIQILFGIAEHRKYSWYSMTVSLLNLALSIALARPLGILGVALGTSIPIFLGRLYMNDYFRRVLQLRLWPYYREVWQRVGVLAILFAGLLWLEGRWLSGAGVFVHLAVYAFDFAAFEAAGFFWALRPAEREIFIGVARRALRRS